MTRIVVDRLGALWVAAASGLYRRKPDGEAERYAIPQGLLQSAYAAAPHGDLYVSTLFEDTDGRFWADARLEAKIPAREFGGFDRKPLSALNDPACLCRCAAPTKLQPAVDCYRSCE